MKKKIHGNTGNDHALKLPEERRTQFLRLAVTNAEKRAFEKSVKKANRSKWLRNVIFKNLAIALIGAAHGALLALQG